MLVTAPGPDSPIHDLHDQRAGLTMNTTTLDGGPPHGVTTRWGCSRGERSMRPGSCQRSLTAD